MKSFRSLAQPDDVGAAGTQDFPDLGGIHDREQQVLDRHEFMPRLARAGKARSGKIQVLDLALLRLF